jgi:phage-related protein (TIGR01555 family)
MTNPWWQFWQADSTAPSAPATAAPKQTRLDGWANVLTGLGIRGRDKRLGATFASCRMAYEECRELWRGNDLAAIIVERPPSDMLRQGFDVKLGEQAEQLGPKVKAKLDDLQTTPALKKALQYQRAYGGAAIWLGVDDGNTNLTQPLKENAIRSFAWLEVYSAPREIQAATWNTDPNSKNFGKPETYRVITGGRVVELHHSRVLIFTGPVLDRQHQQEMQGFGDSVFVRVRSVLSDFGQSFEAVPLLIADFSQSVYKLKDLAMLIASNQEGLVTARVQMMELMRSILRGVIIDKDEEWSRQSTAVTGLSDLLDKLTFRLAAAASIPVTLLFGQAPAGLNATGDSDVRNY